MEKKLLQRRQELAKIQESERLAEVAVGLRENILQVRHEKDKMKAATKELSDRIDRLQRLAEELEHSKQLFAQCHAQRHSEEQRRCVSQAESRKGMLQFATNGMDAQHLRPTRQGPAGRSSRRTGYTTDYHNTRILGPCEFAVHNEFQHRSMELSARRHLEASQVELPMVRGSSVVPSLFGPGYFGKPTAVNLEEYRKRSTNRTRFYSDYHGQRIKMDPRDWPSVNGVVLT